MRHEDPLIKQLGEIVHQIAEHEFTKEDRAQIYSLLTWAQEVLEGPRTEPQGLRVRGAGEGEVSNEEDPFFGGKARISISEMNLQPSGQAVGTLEYEVWYLQERLILRARSPLKARTYLPVRQASLQNPGVMIIIGQGQIERSGDLALGEFTLWLCDGGEEPRSDRFQIIISSDQPKMSHASGLMVLDGQVEMTNS